jgi:dTMP kinase
MAARGKFIVIDGMDGSGKGTQLALLRGKVSHLPVEFTREPGGTPYAEEIREMLMRNEMLSPPTHPLCDFFLFWAARASHIELKIWPGRDEGKHFITDRYDSSTFAFQIYGEARHDYERLFIMLRKEVGHRFEPDAYIFLDLPAEVAYERREKDRSQAKTRFDYKPLEYHNKVRHGFQHFQQVVGYAGEVHLVNANRPPEEIHSELAAIVLNILEK